MKKIDVVGLGFCAADFLLVMPRYPNSGERVQAREMSRQGGGEVATALVSLARLGSRASFIGKIGSDDLGKFIVSEFQKEGVDTKGMVVEEGKNSIFALCAVEEKTGQRTIFFYHDASLLKPEELNKELITSSRVLHLDQYETEAGLVAIEWAKESGVLTTLDVDDLNERTEDLVKKVDFVIGSEKFSRYFAGEPGKACGQILKFGPKAVAITLGEKGCLVKTADEEFITPAFKIKVVDTTGAGDVFHGAFIYGLLQNWPLKKTASFANASAALKCTKLGGRSGIPTRKEVENFLQSICAS